MTFRWRIPLAAAVLTLGSLGAAVGSAATAGAASTVTHPGTTPTRPGGAVGGFHPGGLIRAHSASQPSASAPSASGHSASQPSAGAASSGTTRSARDGSTTSTNWSGYVVHRGTGALQQRLGELDRAHGQLRQRDTSTPRSGSASTGTTPTVEQTGTDTDCRSGSPDYYGWYEMFPADPVYFTNPVAPGDCLSASVAVSGKVAR